VNNVSPPGDAGRNSVFFSVHLNPCISASILHRFCTGDEVVISMQYSTVLALVIRVAIALATRTFFQPDEYFQALEPAHFLVFGYGDLTWEWTSKPPIRTILYPALNIPIYWLLKIFRLDGTFLLVRWSRTFLF
jgi:hypothetical protein